MIAIWGSWIPSGAPGFGVGRRMWTDAISSSNRNRVTSTSCTSESLTIIVLSKLGGTAALRCTQCSTSGWPNSPASISVFSSAYSGSNRRMKPTWISRTPSSASRRTTSSAESTSVVSGFSHSTGLRCSRHASNCLSCVGPGVASTTASTSGSAMASNGSDTTRHPGTPAAISSARVSMKSLTTATFTPAMRVDSRSTWSAPITPTPSTATRRSDICTPGTGFG